MKTKKKRSAIHAKREREVQSWMRLARKPTVGVEGLIHAMSDTALRSSLGILAHRYDDDPDIPAYTAVYASLRRLMPTVEESVLCRVVRDLVIDEIVHRWSRDYDKVMRKRSKAAKRARLIRTGRRRYPGQNERLGKNEYPD